MVISIKISKVIKIINKQESPPAWTQEAYRPPCSKYSLCCPNWVPPPARVSPQPGYPLARVPPSRVPPARVPPNQGTPPARVPPRPGYPPGQGTPLAREPPQAGPGRVPPPPAAPWHSGKCCKALWDMGTPPCGQTDWWKDRRVSKHYLPVVLRTRAVIKVFLRDHKRRITRAVTNQILVLSGGMRDIPGFVQWGTSGLVWRGDTLSLV